MGRPSTTLDSLSYVLCAVRQIKQHIQHDEYLGVRQITLTGKLVYIRLLELVEHRKTVPMNIYLILNCYLVQPHFFLWSPIHAHLCREALILINPDKGCPVQYSRSYMHR